MLKILGGMRADNKHAAEGSSSLHRNAFFRLSLAAGLHCSPKTHDRHGMQKKASTVSLMEIEEKPYEPCYEKRGVISLK